MGKECKEEREERGYPRSNGLTLQAAAHRKEALRTHVRRPSFSPLLRCETSQAVGLPSFPRLAGSKNNAARRSKIFRV